MNFITKGLNRLKANSIYSERGFEFDKELTTVDDINAMALAKREEDKFLAFDYLLFNYYYSPCAYTASNLIAGYIDFYSEEAELSENLPTFDFIETVGKYLEKASKVADVFDSKEYFITLAQFFLLQNVDNLEKAFNLLNSVPTAYMDVDVQYLTGTLYFLLGMKEVAVKMLESAKNSENTEIKASSALLLAKCNDDEKKKEELLRVALLSTKTAIVTEAITLLVGINKTDIVANVDMDKILPVLNADLVKVLAETYFKSGENEKLEKLGQYCVEDEIYQRIIDCVKAEEVVDVEQITIEVNKKHIEEIADSDMYKESDIYTRRMLNNEIMETAMESESFSELDYIVFSPCYVK